MKDINGKVLKRAHYEILKELGIEIVMYDLKTYEDNSTSGMHQSTNGKVSYGFEIFGSLGPEVDFDELHDLLCLLKQARDSNVPAVKDALEKLRIIIRVSNE